MSCQGEVKSFSAKQGWGFIVKDGADIFLHIKECGAFIPKQGSIVQFDPEASTKQAGQTIAKNVTAVRTGSCEGIVKSFVDKQGYGFIEHNGADIFLHMNDCVDGRPLKGDVVNFDLEDSDKNPGQKTAKRVVGCSRPLELDKGKGKGKGMDKGQGKPAPGGWDGFGMGGYGPAAMWSPMMSKGDGWGGPPMGGGWGGPPAMGYDCKGGGWGGGYDCKGGGWGGGGGGYDCKGGGYDCKGGGYDCKGGGYDCKGGGYGCKGFESGPYGKGGGKMMGGGCDGKGKGKW